MATMILTTCFFTSVLFSASVSSAPATVPAVIPKPVQMAVQEGRFELNAQTVIVASGDAAKEGQMLAEALRTPTGLALTLADQATETNAIVLTLDKSLAGKLDPEGYRLKVTPKRVTIQAAGAAGLFYGGVTLRQLMPEQIFSPTPVADVKPGGWSAAGVEIEDYPRFVWRGMLLDSARHFLTPGDIQRFIDLAAMHKLNRIHMHLTDDQGWRVEIKKYPKLTEIGSTRKESPKAGDRRHGDGTPYGPFFYTQAQLREFVAYAQARHITLVPEIDMPGHMLAALAGHPELSCTGGPFDVCTRWGVMPDILCAGNDKTFAFVEDVLSEILDIFPSEFIHIGGDEAPRDRWKTCPKCQARIKAEGLKNEAELQSYFNRRIEKFLTSKGRRLIGWDEIMEGGITESAAVMSWRNSKAGAEAAESKHDVVMTPTSHCYLDYAQSKAPGEQESIGGFVPLELVYSFDPMPKSLPAELQRHILGAQGNLWSEYLYTAKNVEFAAFPRLIAMSEVTWSPIEGRKFEEFRERLAQHLKRLDPLKVNYRKLDPAEKK